MRKIDDPQLGSVFNMYFVGVSAGVGKFLERWATLGSEKIDRGGGSGADEWCFGDPKKNITGFVEKVCFNL